MADQDESNRLHIEVDGLGVISINRTDEGVIIDVFGKQSSSECLGTLAVEDSEFSEEFADALQESIEQFDPAIDLDSTACLDAYKRNVSNVKFIEEYFRNNDFNLGTLIPLKGECKPFSEQVAELTGPYIEISTEQYNALMNAEADFYRTKGGKVLTFGAANGGYALMTLQDAPAQQIIENSL